MTPSSLKNLYMEQAPTSAPRPALNDHIATDICIVGAGLTSLGAALTLARQGTEVRVLEALSVGAGASGVNGGQIHPGQRRDQAWLEARLGKIHARELWDIAEEARCWLGELISSITQCTPYKCDYQPGLLHLAHRPRHFRTLAADAEYLEKYYSVANLEVLNVQAIKGYTQMRDCYGGVLNPHGGHLNPFSLTQGIASLAEQAGALLHEQSRVTKIYRQGSNWCVVTGTGIVRAKAVLLTGDGSLDSISETTAAHVMPLINFMVATAPLDEALIDTVLSRTIAASDTRFVVNYFRRTIDNRIIFGGGESYGSGLPDNFVERVRCRMLHLYPQLANATISHGWGGRLGITMPRLPFIREIQPGLYVASGYSGQGVMLAPYTGRIIAEAMMGDSMRFEKVSNVPVSTLPGGRWLRRPLLIAAMIGSSFLDQL